MEGVEIDASTPFIKAEFRCKGTEKDPNECPHQLAVGPSTALSNCSKETVVGLTCLHHHVELRLGSKFKWTVREFGEYIYIG